MKRSKLRNKFSKYKAFFDMKAYESRRTFYNFLLKTLKEYTF